MKRKVLSLLLLAAHLVIYAQLKVDSNGKVYIANNSNTSANGILHVGDMSYMGSSNANVQIRMTDETSGSALMGTLSLARPASGTSRSGKGIGLFGHSTCSTTNYGTVGNIAQSDYGVGVYGGLNLALPTFTSSRYAGYFDGATYVNGRLTATEVVTPSDINLKENIQLLSNSTENTLDNILNMNVIKYNYKHKEISEEDFISEEKDELAKDIKASIEQNEKAAKQIHFGLSAQELQEIYPELVRKEQDGTLGINYIELVPILIRSIQELKQELDAVKGTRDVKTRSAYDEEDYKVVSTQNVLYQNNPNPFKEQTTIRFRLADDVQNASICIFDMSGKMLKKFPISSGMDSVSVAGYELGEGMFLYSLIVNGKEIDTKKMVITK